MEYTECHFLYVKLLIVFHVPELQAGCPEMLEYPEECKKFLTPENFNILTKRLIEARVPEGDRVYCPYANCSTLMDKSGLDLPEQVLNPLSLCVTCRNYVFFSLQAPNIGFFSMF